MWLQPNFISFRCRKPTLIIRTFNFRRKPSGTVKEQLPALPPVKPELYSTERNSPARSFSCTNSIPHVPQCMVLDLGKFIVLHSRYVLLRNNLIITFVISFFSSPFLSTLLSPFQVHWFSYHSGNAPSILLFLDSLCLYILRTMNIFIISKLLAFFREKLYQLFLYYLSEI